MRLTGFASGMDINQMVSDLMRAQRMPLNKLTQQKQILEWKRDDYREVNRLLKEFDDLSFNMTLQRSFTSKTVTSSNSNAVTATASSTAVNGTHKISNIKPATSASNYSQTSTMRSGQSLDLNASLWSERNKFSSDAMRFGGENGTVWRATDASFEEYKVSTATDKVNIGKTAIQKGYLQNQTETITVATSDGIEKQFEITFDKATLEAAKLDPNRNVVYIDQDSGDMTFSDQLQKDDVIQGFDFKHFTFSFDIGTYNAAGDLVQETFTFDATSSMNDLIKEINGKQELGVTVFFDEGRNGIMISRNDVGAFHPDYIEWKEKKDKEDENIGPKPQEIVLSGLFLQDVMKIDLSSERGGEMATFEYNDMPTYRNSNTFQINGVTFNLHEEMTSSVRVTVNNNVDQTFDTIKNYVDKYNELLEKINGKLTEEVFRDYKPLSDDERESLTDKQAEQWEEKAKSGLLRNDSILASALNRMRTSFYSRVETSGTFNQLAQIGISTSSNYMERGKLHIDEEKLRAAIVEDPQSVMELFNKPKGEDGSQGIARQLRESVQLTTRQIEQRAGNATRTNQQFTIGRELNSIDQRVTQFESRLKLLEDRYWRQFTAMEKAMDTANSQAMQLMSMFYPQG